MFRLTLILISFFAFQLQSKNQRVSLKNALHLNLVTCEAKSLGAYQGYCMNMRLKNLSNDSVIILLEAGIKLNSMDDKYQDILVTKEEIIALKRNEEKLFKLKGYCCQASNCAPSLNAKYSFSESVDSNLVKLATFLNTHHFEQGAEQHAIWAISNKHLTANITSVNDTTALLLKQMVSNLKNEKLPWYQIVTNTYVYKSGRMEILPICLKGQLNYSCEVEDYVTLSIKNKKGLPVCFIISQWLRQGTNQKYDLNIPLKGLSKGEYTIELKTLNKELVRQEFEI